MHVEIVKEWNEKLNLFPKEKKDIYFSEDYVKLSSGKTDEPLCIICEEGNRIMLMPFLRNNFNDLFDFETPYGYGGPISNSDDMAWNNKALNAIIEKFRNSNYIAGFIRFHPLLNNADLCRNNMEVIDDRKTIAIKTSDDIEDIWKKQISSKNRNMIRKAEKNDLRFYRDNDFKFIESFKKLYNSTMERLEATDFYFFDDDYYNAFVKIFSGKGFLGCVFKGDEIISSALFMYEGDFGHYHLAGSNRMYSSLGANNYLLWNTACELHKESVKEFHLGGGINSDEENSLFKFKHSFSPNTKQFSIGKIIFNDDVYKSVCYNWEINNPDKVQLYKNHLLKYRY